MARSNLVGGSELLAAATKKRIRFLVAGGGGQEARVRQAHVRRADRKRIRCGLDEN